jgi:two-component system NtrC family sensor kinase
VLRAALALQAPGFELQHIQVVSELEPTLPQIWADPHQLQQVFLNLFTNAAQAMQSAHGRGTLTVRSAYQDSLVYVEVEDDGPGIPQEHLGRIFDPFFTTKDAGEGTGLGLSLSIGIIETHGGQIRVENVPGAGARFTVMLPVGEAAGARAIPALEPPELGHWERILVVDDESELQEILVEILRACGYQAQGAATAQEAIANCERQAYDCVMLDLRLPDMRGEEVWRWILMHDPALASRVVFMTGDTMSPETQRFLQEAGRPVLTKPPSLERVRQVLGEVLAQLPD